MLAQLNSVPTVALSYEDLSDFPGDLVIHDRSQAIREIVDHLVSVGRSRIAIMLASEITSNTGKIKVFTDRLRHHGLPVHGHELLELDFPDIPENHRDRHVTALRRRFGDTKDVPLDAIFCINDIGAMYTIRELKGRGLNVPNDIAVVGFNDFEPGRVWEPPLATVDRVFDETAIAIDRLLSQRLADTDQPPLRDTVHMRFIHRESAGVAGS